jgi:hypothetical protein
MPFWVHKKNNNLMGVRVACLFHAAVIEEAPREYKALADAAGVPRRSVKNMIAVTQAGHDEVARRVYRGCRHRSWPARVCVASMVPGFLSELPWMSDRTARMAISECNKTFLGFRRLHRQPLPPDQTGRHRRHRHIVFESARRSRRRRARRALPSAVVRGRSAALPLPGMRRGGIGLLRRARKGLGGGCG